MSKKETIYYACDFETTVYEGQDYTEVWLSGAVEIDTGEGMKTDGQPVIFGSIDGLFTYFKKERRNIVAYFHNLKFDGAFWLDYLLIQQGMEQAAIDRDNSGYNKTWIDTGDMKNGTFKYAISDMGQWYSITIKHRDRLIQIRDSLKLLPFPLKAISKSFNTLHKKLTMEYKGLRYANCPVTEDERQYFLGDLYVLKEGLEVMFAEGHTKLTIGACCLSEFKTLFNALESHFDDFFPNVYDIKIDPKRHGDISNAGEWIRKAYKGGWSYLVPEKANKIIPGGLTADVNSLYPSVMSSDSKCYYPTGRPKFWTGSKIPEEATDDHHYYFIRIRCRFRIKSGYLPFIQIKGNLLYKPTESLTSSDVYNRKTKQYHETYINENGQEVTPHPELTLTGIDYKLFLEHYDVEDLEILDGCYFKAAVGLFDEYINKYKKIKQESKGALRTLAKLFLNNLYGKFAASLDSSFKFAYIKDDKSVGFYDIQEADKIPGYIPVGAAVTSWARNFTIRAAQKNFHGPDKPGFIYADTDSIHCDLTPDDLIDIPTHPTDFCKWKLESTWDKAIFVRQKTYIEHVTQEDLEDCQPYYNIKCAGMPEKTKNLFKMLLEGAVEYAYFDGFGVYTPIKYTEEEKQFLSQNTMTLHDFKVGLSIPGKLRPKRIRGGVILIDTPYEMRPAL